MDAEKYSGLRMDFHNLISCIQVHDDFTNTPVIIETLKTIVDICTNEDCGRDAFREAGGLDFLMELVSTTDSTILLEHLLNTLALAIDENVHCQMYMTKQEYFRILQVIIGKPSFPPSVIKNALLFSAAILFQNSHAQSLISENGYLQDLINVFEISAPQYLSNNYTKPTSSISSEDIWISANSALCFAVNNPQNEKNQETCSILFPLCLKLLESSSDTTISNAISSFLSLCLANNVKNQNKFADCDGLLVLKRCVQKNCDLMELDMKEFNSIVAKSNIHCINNIIGIISAVASENGKNAALLGKLGVLNFMVKLLKIGVPNDQLQTRIMLSIACCIDADADCKSYILQFTDFHNFLRNNFQNGDTELVSASKYLLQVCVDEEGAASLNNVMQEDDHSVVFSSVSNRGKGSPNVQKIISDKSAAKEKVMQRNKSFNFITKEVGNLKDSFNLNFSKDLYFDKHKMQTMESDPKCSPQDTSEYPFMQPEINLHHDKLNTAESHHKNRRSSKKKLSRYSKKGSSKFPHCSSVKSYSNSKKENIFLIKPTSSKDSVSSRKRRKCFEEVNESHSCVLNCKSMPHAFGSSNVSLKLSEVLSVPSKRFKYANSQKSLVTDYKDFSKFAKEYKSVQSGVSNYNQSTSRTAPFIENDFHPFSKPFIDELKHSFFSGQHKSNPEFDLLQGVDDSCNNVLQFNDNNLFNKCTDKLTSGTTVQREVENFSCNIEHELHERQISLLKQFNDLLDEIDNGSNKDSTTKNIKKKQKKINSRNLESSKTRESLQDLDYVHVIVFPGENCEQHNLISNFEMLRVVPLEDV